MDTNYLLLGKQPISEAQPAGKEVRAEPAFERLQAELDKLSSPSLAAQVDWAKVESAAAELLQHSGKDVLVACYLCYALTLRHGLKGLETGLVILADMHSSYWESMHPKLARMRARRNAVEWLLEKCLGLFEQDGPLMSQTYSPALVVSIQEQISTLDTVLDAHMPDAPSFFKLRNLVAALSVEEEAQPEPAVELAQEVAVEVPATTAAAHAQPPVPLSAARHASATLNLANPEQAATAIAGHLSALATQWRGLSHSDFRAYQFNRVAAWCDIDAVPPHDMHQTAIPAPLEQMVQALERLQSLMLDAEIIEFCENQLVDKPFWLDLQFACFQALQRLGDSHAQAAAVVEAETRLLIQRMPEILGLHFSDGSPFAGPETQAWLAASQSSAPGTGVASADAPLARVLAASAAQAAEDNMLGAAQILQDGIRQSQRVTGRERLQAKVQFARLLLEKNTGFQASALAADLQAMVERHVLAEWDPEFAVEVLEVCYQMRLASDDLGQAQAVLQQIAHLDLAAFSRLSHL